MESYCYTGEILLEHRIPIEQIRRLLSHKLSSHAFASLYLWRNYLGLKLCLGDAFFTAKTKIHGENAWLFPCGEEKEKERFIEMRLEEDDFFLCYLGEEDKIFLETRFPGRFRIWEEEASAEYLYDRKEYETISGGRFSNMRKQIRHLQKEHALEIRRLGDENLNLAWEMLHESVWETKALDVAKDALAHRKELDISGILTFVDGKARSLVMGFPLTHDTLDGCLDCSDTSVRGLSYYGKREFFLASKAQYRYLNAEEDLGIPGLRMMKRHMSPVGKNRTWNAKNIRG